jgi:hypothetical protein
MRATRVSAGRLDLRGFLGVLAPSSVPSSTLAGHFGSFGGLHFEPNVPMRADQLVNNEAQTNMLRRAVTKVLDTIEKILDTIESVIYFFDYFSDIPSPYNKFNEGPPKFEKAKSR